MKPKTLILRTAGTNCDVELAAAFERAGAAVCPVHLNRLIESPDRLDAFDLLGIPGGFSYGDDIAAGTILANRLRHRLYTALRHFVQAGKPVIGICNGFQVLVKAGLLPGFELPEHTAPPQQLTLTDNANPRFLDCWCDLLVEPDTRCIWTRGLERLPLPIAHGEGRLVGADDLLDRLEADGQVALRYDPNPNGSARNIAGLCNPAGTVLGLMPHPERFVDWTQHPYWTRLGELTGHPAGLKMFTNAVEHVSQPATSA